MIKSFYSIFITVFIVNLLTAQKYILIDPGHGGTYSGAVRDGVYEKNINLAVANKLYNAIELSTNGWTPFITRHTDITIYNNNRWKMANKYGTDNGEPWTDDYGNEIPDDGVNVFISIHCNATVNVNDNPTYGTELYYGVDDEDYNENYDPDIDFQLNRGTKSADFATVALQTFLKWSRHFYKRAQSKWVRYFELSDTVVVMTRTKMPAVLVEMDYLSNQAARDTLQLDEFQEQAANGLWHALDWIDPIHEKFVETIVDKNIDLPTQWNIGNHVLIKNTTTKGSFDTPVMPAAKTISVVNHELQINSGAYVVVDDAVSVIQGTGGTITVSDDCNPDVIFLGTNSSIQNYDPGSGGGGGGGSPAISAPSNTDATVLSQTGIRINWQDNSDNEDGFEIQREINDSGSWTSVNTVEQNVESYEDNNLESNTEYQYRIRAYKGADYSDWTYSDEVRTLPYPPAAPSNVNAYPISSATIRVTWQDNSNNEDGFRVYFGEVINGTWHWFVNTQVKNRETRDVAFAGWDNYQAVNFQVVAYNRAAEASSSEKFIRINSIPNNTINYDTWFSRDFSIPSNTTITINSGKKVYLGDYVSLICPYGSKIIANGTSAHPIKFKKLYTNKKWKEIRLVGNNNQFNYCLFDGGVFNVCVKGDGTSFTNCTFTHGQFCGLLSEKDENTPSGDDYHSEFTMYNCLVENNVNGLYCGYSDCIIENCTIRNNTSDGISIGRGWVSPILSKIQNNGVGIIMGYEAWLRLSEHNGNNTYQGHNLISDNINEEIKIVDNMGQIYPYCDYGSRTDNNWYCDLYDETGYLIDNIFQSTAAEIAITITKNVVAEGVYWGTSTGPAGGNSRFTGAPGSVDWHPYFSGSQITGYTVGHSGNLPLNKINLSDDNTDSLQMVNSPKINNAHHKNAQLFYTASSSNDKNPSDQEKINSLKEQIVNINNQIMEEPSSIAVAGRLLKLYFLMREDIENKTNEIKNSWQIIKKYHDKINALYNSEQDENFYHKDSTFIARVQAEKFASEMAILITVNNLINTNEVKQASQLIKQYEPKITNYDIKRSLKFAELDIYKARKEWEKALAAIQQLKEIVRYSDVENYQVPDLSSEENYIRINLGLEPIEPEKVEPIILKKTLIINAPKIPKQYALKQNYPNPFNPITTIPFDLPQESQVKISIYNILGQKMGELTNKSYEAGSHTITFNGQNMASGIYIVQAIMTSMNKKQDNQYVFNKKIMLLK
jgi:N-acetylmuramoyl-L-alanine amidase/predicted RecA/RadA family phage recombinase